MPDAEDSAEVAAFLRAHPPFDALDDAELAALAAAAEPEEYPAGAVILAEGGTPPAHVRVVRRGGVEIVHGGRVLDLLGPGELFGHAAMLSGLPVGFTAVARGDTACLRLPAAAVRPILGRPSGLRYVTRSLLVLAAPAAGGGTRPGAAAGARAAARAALHGHAGPADPRGRSADDRLRGERGRCAAARRRRRHPHRPRPARA